MSIKYPKIADVKNWNVEIEKEITSQWKKAEAWNFNPKTKKKIYSVDTPPPYINSPIHMGHATSYAFMDMFARYKRMKGFEVLFPLGLDRNGLPIEMAAEKKFEVSPFKVGREKFVELCEKILEMTSETSTGSFERLGISFTSYKEGDHIGAVYKTDSPEYRALTQATFADLYRRGLIYEAKRINNWDTKLQTTVADAEIDYMDIPSTFNHVKFKVKETGEDIIIATTRPELIGACGMIIYNPEDKRYQHLEGKTAITPVYGLEVPIQEHPYAKIDKGTGLVMMCSAGDVTDIQFFREMNLRPRILINADGKMNEYAGILHGLKVKDARSKMIEELKKEKLLVKQDQIMHSTPVSERSKAEIEFIEMPEYYLKQVEFVDELREITRKLKFYPEEARRILDSWLDSVSIDWPISRRRFYATPVPLWHAEDMAAVPLPGKYYQPWREAPPKDAEVFKNGQMIGKVKDFDVKWKGDERVLDTWFDSSISELFILKYKKDDAFFKKAFPATIRPQGKEIVRTWLYYTILRGYLETGKLCFDEAWVHQHILDEKGKKMSKSLGNVIDPQEILRDYGAEAMRMWAAIEGDLSKQDFICSKEKIKAELKTLNKILNVAKFIMQFSKPKKKPKLTKLDQLFVDQIEGFTRLAEAEYNEYDFHQSALRLRNFLWETFASHYLEIVKSRAYNAEKKFSKEESDSAIYALYYLLERWIVLMYPIIPQITSVLAAEFDIKFDELPKAAEVKSNLDLIEKIMDFNKLVWKTKKDRGISLKESVEGIDIPKEIQDFSADLMACHNLE